MICEGCNQEKDTEFFSFKNKSKNIKHKYCKECKKNYQRTWYLNHKQAHCINVEIRRKKVKKDLKTLLNTLKSKPCLDCKIQYPPYVMDFDHLGNKMFNVSIAPSRQFSLNKILKEIEKCEVVCSNCHRERTFKRSTNALVA